MSPNTPPLADAPANIVPGISYSPGKLLQGRLFSYGDAQRYRLGVNHRHIPVNAPKCPFHSYHRDGAMRTDGNLGAAPTYFPIAGANGPTSRSSTWSNSDAANRKMQAGMNSFLVAPATVLTI